MLSNQALERTDPSPLFAGVIWVGMRDHYDFSGGVRGKYAKQYAEGTNVVVLDPDVAEVFRDRQSVNETLRAVARIVDLQSRRARA